MPQSEAETIIRAFLQVLAALSVSRRRMAGR